MVFPRWSVILFYICGTSSLFNSVLFAALAVCGRGSCMRHLLSQTPGSVSGTCSSPYVVFVCGSCSLYWGSESPVPVLFSAASSETHLHCLTSFPALAEPRVGTGRGADAEDSEYHLPDDSQVDSDNIILETECPSSDDLNFTPRVQGSHISASGSPFHPQFMHPTVRPRFFPPVSRPNFFTGTYSDVGAMQQPRAMPTFSQHLYNSDHEYGQPLHIGTGLNLNANSFSQD